MSTDAIPSDSLNISHVQDFTKVALEPAGVPLAINLYLPLADSLTAVDGLFDSANQLSFTTPMPEIADDISLAPGTIEYQTLYDQRMTTYPDGYPTSFEPYRTTHIANKMDTRSQKIDAQISATLEDRRQQALVQSQLRNLRNAPIIPYPKPYRYADVKPVKAGMKPKKETIPQEQKALDPEEVRGEFAKVEKTKIDKQLQSVDDIE